MLNIAAALIILTGAIVLLVKLRARDGTPHPLALRPGMTMAIPLAVVMLLIAGTALLITGVLDVRSGL